MWVFLLNVHRDFVPLKSSCLLALDHGESKCYKILVRAVVMGQHVSLSLVAAFAEVDGAFELELLWRLLQPCLDPHLEPLDVDLLLHNLLG